MQGIFSIIFAVFLIWSTITTYRVSRRKGYAALLFAFLQTMFPIMIVIVFALPDKRQANAQQRELDEMRTRIRELERKQQRAESKPAAPKSAPKPVMPEPAAKLTRENVTVEQIHLYESALRCYKKEDMHVLALQYFEQVARAGHLESQMYAAQMNYWGQGTEVNYEKAMYWYEKAAEQGQKVAQSNIAKMYQDGKGCTVNLMKSLYWYEKAAEQGDANAQLWAGIMYELGQGCTKDTKKARYWYEKAAAQGNERAKKLLSNM